MHDRRGALLEALWSVSRDMNFFGSGNVLITAH